MKRILLIAALIFVSCAAAPARSSREGARAGARVSSVPPAGGNLHVGNDTKVRLVESAGEGDDIR